MCSRWGTLDEIFHSMRGGDNGKIFVGRWSGLEPMGTKRRVVNVIRTN